MTISDCSPKLHKFELELTDNAVMMLRAITSVKEVSEKEMLENIILSGLASWTWHLFPPGSEGNKAL